MKCKRGELKASVLIVMQNLYLDTSARDYNNYWLREIMMKVAQMMQKELQ